MTTAWNGRKPGTSRRIEYDENGQAITSGTPLLDFLNTAQFGQLIGQIEGRANGGFGGSLDYAAYRFDALPQMWTSLG